MASMKHNEDSLPKVIICGLTEHNIPKLIVCDDTKKAQKEDACSGPCNQTQSKKTPESAIPNISQRLQTMQQELAAKNAGLAGMRNRIQCDLMLKDQTINTLQNQLCSLQREMNTIATENARLTERIQQATAGLKQEVERTPCGSNYICIESRLNEFTENTKALEKQLCEVECSMKAMKSELGAVQVERANREKNRKIVMMHSPGICGPPPTTPPRASCGGKTSCN